MAIIHHSEKLRKGLDWEPLKSAQGRTISKVIRASQGQFANYKLRTKFLPNEAEYTLIYRFIQG